jgi:hypothetical protein
MNINKQHILTLAPGAIAALLAILLVWQFLHLGIVKIRSHSMANKTISLKSPTDASDQTKNEIVDKKDDKKAKEYLAKYKPIIERAMFGKRKDNNGKGKKKKSSSLVCSGIMGNQAIIDNKLVKVGATIGDATLISIHSNKVVIERNGKKQDISIFPDLNSDPGPQSKGIVANKKKTSVISNVVLEKKENELHAPPFAEDPKPETVMHDNRKVSIEIKGQEANLEAINSFIQLEMSPLKESENR